MFSYNIKKKLAGKFYLIEVSLYKKADVLLADANSSQSSISTETAIVSLFFLRNTNLSYFALMVTLSQSLFSNHITPQKYLGLSKIKLPCDG